MYMIEGFIPRQDISMGAHAFTIHLSPAWKETVARSGVDDEKAQLFLGRFVPVLAKSLNMDARQVRMKWGEWGIEYLYVDMDCCCMGIDSDFSFYEGGRRTSPHNIDNWRQKNLMLGIYLEFFSTIEWATRT